MPANRKKKPASNPARGFATVSIPKLKATDHTGASPTGQSTIIPDNGQSLAHIVDENSRREHDNQVHPQYTSSKLEQHLEDAEVQSFIDKFASRCKSDASRQASRLDTERRILRPQAGTLDLTDWLPPEALNLILDLGEKEEQHDRNPEHGLTELRRPLDEDELCTRLWTLTGTLFRLGFPDLKVEDLLKYLLRHHTWNTVDRNKDVAWKLDESLHWLALHCDLDDLPCYDRKELQLPKATEFPMSWITEDQQAQSLAINSPIDDNSTSKKQESQTQVINSQGYGSDESDSTLDPDDLIPEFLSLRSQLYNHRPNLFKHSKTSERGDYDDLGPQFVKVRQKLAKIEKDVLFDHAEAEILWKEKLTLLRNESAFFMHKSQSQIDYPSEENRGEVKKTIDDHHETRQKNRSQSVNENDLNLGLFGEMFIDNSSTTKPSIESDSRGGRIQIRDFGQSSGLLSPRRVLEESCKARDSGCKVVYKNISSSTYSNRQAVEVQWSKPRDAIPPIPLHLVSYKSSPYAMFASMDEISTPTSQQAECFISTLALFLLSVVDTKDSKLYLRLSAPWRDLVAEFADTKKKNEEETDKQTIKNLKTLIKANLRKSEGGVVLTNNLAKRDEIAKREKSSHTPQVADESIPKDYLKQLWLEKTYSVSFQRMIRSRIKLPVWNYKQEILKVLAAHQAMIICGETGSGKSTQIPSFILEQELLNGRSCKIYVTEPRRISAISLAKRVSEELGENQHDLGTIRSLVGYAIRLESKVNRSTRLVYATTGVILRMLEHQPDFQDITHIVLDEVHERSIESDFLLLVLRRIMLTRPQLKVVLMSATVNAQQFSSYLGGAPILNIPGQSFPVKAMYLEDAIELTNHRLDEDQIRTSFDEVDDPSDEIIPDDAENDGQTNRVQLNLEDYTDTTKETVLKFNEYRLDYGLITKLVLKIATEDKLSQYSKAILIFMPGLAEIRRLRDIILANPAFDEGWTIHVLHSSISSGDQEKAFILPPEEIRKIVIATNIAETGITIPDITAVIDAGKEKVMRFDERRQLSRLAEGFISRANAKQRRGRAGRVRPGICFHLFTKYRHDKQLEEHQAPEILRLSLQDLILRVKICNLGEAEETLLKALDPPSSKNIRRAVESLKEVKALTSTESLTPLGKQLANLPLDVLLGKLIIYGSVFKCLGACVSIAAILSSKSPFLSTAESTTSREYAILPFKRGDSDLLTAYNAYSAWKRMKNDPGMNEYAFCRRHFLSPQALSNIEDIKTQLLVSLVDTGLLKLDAAEQASLNRARFTVRQRHFFTIPGRFDINGENDLIINSVIAWSFYPKLLTREGKGWRNVVNNQIVSLHPTSVNKRSDSCPGWFSFYHIMRGGGKFYNAHETSAVEDIAVALLCGDSDFKLYSGLILIDGNRIRFSVKDWKTMLAFKILSTKVRNVISEVFRNPRKNLSPRQEEWLALWRLVFRKGGDDAIAVSSLGP